MSHSHCLFATVRLPDGGEQDHAGAEAAMATARSATGTTVFDEPDLWRVNLGAAFSDLVPGPLDGEPSPSGTLCGGRLARAGVFPVSGSPQTVCRPTTAVRHSPADMLKVCVQLRGRATVHQDDREIVL